MLVQRMGKLPDAWISPWEAIARGAARHSLQRFHTATPLLSIASSCTHSVGIEWDDPVAKRTLSKTLIKRNTPLPAQVSREVMMRGAPRKQFAFTVWQGDADEPQHRTLIGRALLEDLPADLAADWPIDLKVDVGTNGRITVDAAVRYTPQAVHLVMQRPDCVSRTHFNLWQPVVESLGGLRAYQAASDQEEFRNTKIPVVVQSSRPAEAEQERQDEPPTAEESRLWALLRRLMPFHLRRLPAKGEGENHSQPDTATNPTRSEPTVLEVIEG
jgi:molecular chaperone DnaK (HSP70)